MRKLKVTLFVIVAYLLIAPLAVHAAKINFPDILGYKTLKCDFHMHTVFSDGQVWPTTRVSEAVREGLDVIAITDHIEYQPHRDDIPTNHGRSNEIAREAAEKSKILFPLGAEITRSTPPGHFNALFLRDVRYLDTEDFLDAMKAANDQDAFVFWNHPDWKPEHIGWFDVHDTIYENGWIHGIEVCNGDGYHLNGHKWGLEKNLTMLGTSDIHSPSMIIETTPENHRTMTLVFVKEHTLKSLKEALFKGRTAVWFKNQLIAKEDYLDAIFTASVELNDINKKGARKVILEIANNCDLNIELKRTGTVGPEEVALPAMGTTTIKLRVPKDTRNVELSYVASNMLIAPEKGLAVKLSASLE
ncbi:MAG: PHP domain-containing protein [Phycisphaerales bacterium]|nr:MAG: PHP domain-containing protein [Phycisphaerales bacterium]